MSGGDKVYYYKIYGLFVLSQIEMKEAERIEKPDHIDVTIIESDMPDFIKEKKKEGFTISHARKKYAWMYFPEVGDFLTVDGHVIKYRLTEKNDLPHAKSIILGTCFGDIMYQRDLLNIHGSAVETNNKAIVISGQSGSGKSTISHELKKLGCRVLADDTVVVNLDDSTPKAVPGYPQQKLCKDMALKLGYNLKELIKLEEEKEKYGLLLKKEYCNNPMPISILVILEKEISDFVSYQFIESGDKIEYLLNSLYINMLYKKYGMEPSVFNKCIEFVKKVKILRIRRPLDKDTSEEIAKYIFSIVD